MPGVVHVSDSLEHAGYSVVSPGLSARVVQCIVDLIECAGALAAPNARIRRRTQVYAIRDLLDVIPEIRVVLADSPVPELLRKYLGPAARIVRSTLFDKTPEANWKVGWHQDLSIAVRHRKDVAGFTGWSVKAGVIHAQPPSALLERMLTLRLHLDDCGAEGGALRVIPGSHAAGRLSLTEIEAWKSRGEAVACEVSAGDVIVLRPLLLHSSAPATTASHRRVIQLECSADELPPPLEWQERLSVG